MAMKTYPNARDIEFKQLFHKIPLREDEKILDVPALGGYLKKYCLDSNEVLFLDFAKSMNGIDVVSPYEKWQIQPVDRIVCLAAIHHIEKLDMFLINMKEHLKETGFVHLADVSKNSNLSKFLDEFVGSHTSTGGHNGKYYDWEKISFPKDLEVIDIQNRSCPWIFNSEHDMANYCRLLFDLRGINDHDILIALKEYVGYEKDNDKIRLDWNLTYIDLKPSPA